MAADEMQKVDAKDDVVVKKDVKLREDYAWGDDGGKVKIYVEFPDGSLGKDVTVEAKFEELKFEVVVHGVGPEPIGVTNGSHPLHAKILPEKCQWRINSSKS